MIKDGTRSGSRYAALMLTPEHGVRLSANYEASRAGRPGGAPRWLRLTRTGTSVTGYESTDGATWHKVGTVDMRGLPATAEVGLFVSSPPKVVVSRSAGTTSVSEDQTTGTATFDNVRVDGAQATGSAAAWQSDPVTQPHAKDRGEAIPDFKQRGGSRTGSTEANGVFTVTGSGEIGPRESPDDPVQAALFGILIGLMVVAAMGVLYMTSEFKRGMIRTTFAASPRRGRVLAAKALVLGSTAFVLGLVATVVSFRLGLPLLRDGGFAPPAYPTPKLTEWPVLRAVIGTAAFVALIAVFALGVGAILRHSAGAITAVLALVILPAFVAIALPTTGALWLMRLTPAGGFAIQRAKPPTNMLAEAWSSIDPWAGLGVVCAYAVVALALAAWLLRRRDV
jgi:hypothetical protein